MRKIYEWEREKEKEEEEKEGGSKLKVAKWRYWVSRRSETGVKGFASF